MNTLIHEIANLGLSNALYSYVNTAAGLISLCYSLWHGKKLGIPFWKVLIIMAVVYLGLGPIQGFTYTITKFIQSTNIIEMETVIMSIVRAFVYLPLLAIPLAFALRLKWSLVCDAIALYPLLTSAIGQLACVFPGCCHGYVSDFGIFSIQTGLYHFPAQIVETILTLGIFFYLVFRLKRRGYTSDGMLYPEMMALYGAMRFLCEGLRDNEKVFLGCSEVSLHALLMCVIGLAILLHKEKKNKKEIQTEQMPAENTSTP